MQPSHQPNRRGFSAIEFCAVSTIVGIIAAIVVPRVVVDETIAKQKLRDHYAAAINVAIEKYREGQGEWPDSVDRLVDASELFPEGVPHDPLTGGPFRIDPATHRVE